jgi:hypothetical protein
MFKKETIAKCIFKLNMQAFLPRLQYVKKIANILQRKRNILKVSTN